LRPRTQGKRYLGPLGMFFMLIMVPGCTTTVNSHKGDFGKSQQVSIVEKQEETQGKIANLPYPELVAKGNE
jgi:hypothetical protein